MDPQTSTFFLSILKAIAAVNALTFVMFGWDKYCAKSGWRRVPEKTLLLWSFLGGSVGAKVGQHLFHHKTSKQPFGKQLNAIVILHFCLAMALAYPPTRAMLLDAVFGTGLRF